MSKKQSYGESGFSFLKIFSFLSGQQANTDRRKLAIVLDFTDISPQVKVKPCIPMLQMKTKFLYLVVYPGYKLGHKKTGFHFPEVKKYWQIVKICNSPTLSIWLRQYS